MHESALLGSVKGFSNCYFNFLSQYGKYLAPKDVGGKSCTPLSKTQSLWQRICGATNFHNFRIVARNYDLSSSYLDASGGGGAINCGASRATSVFLESSKSLIKLGFKDRVNI